MGASPAPGQMGLHAQIQGGLGFHGSATGSIPNRSVFSSPLVPNA